MSTEAIILAGGLGTRLQSVVNAVPKPMAQVNGKPFLYYLLNYLNSEGIQKVIFSVGYKHEVISAYFGTSFLSMQIVYVIEDQPLGTGGAISLALKEATENDVFILNGDTFFPVSLQELKNKHFQTGAETTIALKKKEDPVRYGSVCLDKYSFIISFMEKSSLTSSLINGGIYYLNKKEFSKRDFPLKFSFEKDYLEAVATQHRIAGCIYNSNFIDIGVPESLQKANDDFSSVMKKPI